MLASSETIFRIRAFHELLKVFSKADAQTCKTAFAKTVSSKTASATVAVNFNSPSIQYFYYTSNVNLFTAHSTGDQKCF